MTRDEHLMVIAMEECAEIAQRLSKALRFGMQEVQPGQEATNYERILHEFTDLHAVMGMLDLDRVSARGAEEKRERVEQYLEYSRTQGTLV